MSALSIPNCMPNTSMHHVPPISPTPTLENAHPNAQPIILHRASSKPFGGYQSQYLKTLTVRTSCHNLYKGTTEKAGKTLQHTQDPPGDRINSDNDDFDGR